MTSPALSALITKRAELAGQLRELEAKGDRLRASIVALDGAIHVFDPSYPAEIIPPKRPPSGREMFKYAELTKLVLGVLRTAEAPMTIPQITREVISRKGLPKDNRIRHVVYSRVQRTLERQGRLLERVELGGRRVGWRVASD
jgi:hypothetical protein